MYWFLLMACGHDRAGEDSAGGEPDAISAAFARCSASVTLRYEGSESDYTNPSEYDEYDEHGDLVEHVEWPGGKETHTTFTYGRPHERATLQGGIDDRTETYTWSNGDLVDTVGDSVTIDGSEFVWEETYSYEERRLVDDSFDADRDGGIDESTIRTWSEAKDGWDVAVQSQYTNGKSFAWTEHWTSDLLQDAYHLSVGSTDQYITVDDFSILRLPGSGTQESWDDGVMWQKSTTTASFDELGRYTDIATETVNYPGDPKKESSYLNDLTYTYDCP